jgi:AcrR family transcriptional regulator
MKRGTTKVAAVAKQGGRPTREDSERKMAQLLHSAAEIFIQEGYAGTSMAKIAAAAEIGKPTIYARFGSKANLFSEVVAHILDSHLLAVEECLAVGDPEVGLKKQLSNILAASIEPMFVGLFRLFLAEAHKFPEIFTAFNTLSEGSVRSLVPHLLRIEKKTKLTVPVVDVADMLLAMTNKRVMMESVQVEKRSAVSADEEASKIVDGVLYGVVKR